MVLDTRLREARAKVCFYLLLAAFAVRLLYLTQYAQTPFFWVPALDALYHDLHARSLAGGHAETGVFFRAPLYYHFLAALYWLFGHNFWAVRLVQAALGAASCVLAYLLGERVFRPSVGLVAALAMVLYAPLVFFDGELHSPGLEVFLDLAFLLLALHAFQTGYRRAWLLAGLVLGLSAITRPNILVAVPLVLGWLAWAERRRTGNQRAVCAGLFVAATLLIPGLVTVRNAVVAHDPVFIAAQGGINLYLGNRPEADGYTPTTPKRYAFAGPYEDSVALYGQRAAEEAAGHPLKASEAQAYWMRQVVTWWRQQPGAALRLTARKWVLAWTHREIRNNNAFEFIRAEFIPFLWACPIGFWFAGPFGLLGMGLAWRENRNSRFLTLFVLLYVCSFVLFFVADRFRLPVVPVLLVFAGHSVLWLAERVRERRWRTLTVAGPALAALVLFVGADWFRTTRPEDRPRDFWSAGNRYRELRELPEAEAQYRKALALDRADPEIWMNLGTVQYGTGQFAPAAESFRQALALSPGNASLHYNLGMCLLELKDIPTARAAFEHALQLDPNHRGAREQLGRLGIP